jgi:hypothetical protein
MFIKGSDDTAVFRPDRGPGRLGRPDYGVLQGSNHLPPGPAELRLESYGKQHLYHGF